MRAHGTRNGRRAPADAVADGEGAGQCGAAGALSRGGRVGRHGRRFPPRGRDRSGALHRKRLSPHAQRPRPARGGPPGRPPSRPPSSATSEGRTSPATGSSGRCRPFAHSPTSGGSPCSRTSSSTRGFRRRTSPSGPGSALRSSPCISAGFCAPGSSASSSTALSRSSPPLRRSPPSSSLPSRRACGRDLPLL